jgi:hypothetical protein
MHRTNRKFSLYLSFRKLAFLALRERTLNKKQSPIQAKRFPLKTFIHTPLKVEVYQQ